MYTSCTNLGFLNSRRQVDLRVIILYRFHEGKNWNIDFRIQIDGRRESYGVIHVQKNLDYNIRKYAKIKYTFKSNLLARVSHKF